LVSLLLLYVTLFLINLFPEKPNTLHIIMRIYLKTTPGFATIPFNYQSKLGFNRFLEASPMYIWLEITGTPIHTP